MNIPNANQYINVKKMDPIKNGDCRYGTAYRQVLTSNLFEVRPVLKTIYSGDWPDRGTIQVGPLKGDLLFVWGRRSNPDGEYTIEQFNGEEFREVPLMDQGLLWKAAQLAIPWMEEFVAPYEQQSSFIPYEGDTILEAAKRQRLLRFFQKHNLPLEEKIEEFMINPKKLLEIDPRKLREGEIFQPSEYIWVGVAGINQYGKWFCIFDTKTALELTLGSNYTYGVPPFESDGCSLANLLNVKFVIRVYGQYVQDYHIDIYDIE